MKPGPSQYVLVLALAVFVLWAQLVQAQTLRIFHIDVESADAALLVMPNGKTLLIDSGGNGKGPRLKRAMDDAGVSQIDVFVNSHYHDDHFGGIDELVDAGTSVLVLEAFDRGEKSRCFSAAQMAKDRFADYMRTVGEDARPLRPGDTIALGPLVTITVIGSSGRVIGDTAPVSHCHENDLSVSLLISFAGFKAFFGGDTEKTTEAKIATRDLVMNVDLYKASHHGSDTSSLPAFMNDLQPSVSCSACTNARHPETGRFAGAAESRSARSTRGPDRLQIPARRLRESTPRLWCVGTG